MNKIIPVIHGDVDFIPINKIPDGLKKMSLRENNSFVIRDGEHTGHQHVITAERTQDVSIYLDEATGMHYIEVQSDVKITHPEHRTITIVPGIYREDNETEYNPFEKMLRKVTD